MTSSTLSRNVVSRRLAWPPKPAISSVHPFTPALSSVGIFSRFAHSSAFRNHQPSPLVPAPKEQRRHRGGVAAAAAHRISTAEINIASQFPSLSEATSIQQATAEYPHHITLVKKVKKDGSPCRKCVEVLARIEREGYMHRIDRIVVADEGNPMSEGMNLAKAFKVKTAPFFLVDSNVNKTAPTELYTVYFKLKREILAKDLSEEQKVKDMQESPQVQELVDFI